MNDKLTFYRNPKMYYSHGLMKPIPIS